MLSLLLGFSACSDNDNPVSNESENNPIVNRAPEPNYSEVVCDAPVFVTSSLRPEVSSALSTFLTNITSLDNAEIAIVKNEDIGTYEGKLLDFYNRGGLLVVAEPSAERYSEFAEKYGIPDLLPFDASQDVLLYLTSKLRNHYVLYGTNPFDVENGADPIEASIHSEDITTYYKRRLYEIFSWVKSIRQQKTRARRVQYVTNFDPKVLITECDQINHNFPICMDHCVCDLKGFAYSDEYIDAVNSVVVKNTIYSTYIFEGGKNAGDYYIILNNLIANNSNGWQPVIHDHAGIITKVAGYFMSKIALNSEILSQEQKALQGVEIVGTPSPTTTVGGKNYTAAQKIGFTSSLSASTEALGAIGFSADFESSESMSISDFTIALETGAADSHVKYTYDVQNIAMKDWSSTKDMEKNVPLIARKDFSAKSCWCWRVPVNTNDIKNYSDKSFVLRNKVNYKYDCMVKTNMDMFYTRHHTWNYSNYAVSKLPHPSRVPFGILSLKNNHTYSISHVTVWKEGEYTDTINNKPVLRFSDAFLHGESAVCALEVGTYSIEYDQMNEFNNLIYNSWLIKKVEVFNGGSQEKSTSKATTADAIEVPLRTYTTEQ